MKENVPPKAPTNGRENERRKGSTGVIRVRISEIAPTRDRLLITHDTKKYFLFLFRQKINSSSLSPPYSVTKTLGTKIGATLAFGIKNS